MTTAKELIESGGMGGFQLKPRTEDERKAAFMEVDAETVGEAEDVQAEPVLEEETERAEVQAESVNQWGLTETQMNALPESAKAALRGDQASEQRTEPARPALDPKVVEKLKETLGDEAESMIALLEQSSAATQAVIEMKRQQMIGKHVKVYSELQKPAVVRTVASLAADIQRPGESDDSAFGRALVELYGDRRGETKRQVSGQMSPVRRTEKTTKPMTADAANIAAFDAYLKTGSVAQAQKLRSDLLR